MTVNDSAMSELDPLLARAYTAAREERPRSREGQARSLAALGLAGSAACASPRGATADVSGGVKLFGWPWWAIGFALLATRSESTEFAPNDPTTAIAVVAMPGTVALHEDTAEVATAPSVSVDELPNAVAVTTVRRAPVPTPMAKTSSLREEIDALE
ncbi:MAG: hypothetical protein K0S65_6682, partial [Labilithrix sp.]|nr:hypothetical protein [Labilithrix sp.]